MHVTFHLHVPPPIHPAGPPFHPGVEASRAEAPPAPVLYIRIDSGGDLHTGRSSSVADRVATQDDKRRYKREWMAYEAAQKASSRPAAKVEEQPKQQPPPPPHDKKK